jgi:hypothetical protein
LKTFVGIHRPKLGQFEEGSNGQMNRPNFDDLEAPVAIDQMWKSMSEGGGQIGKVGCRRSGENVAVKIGD